MILGIAHVAFNVSDMDASMDFYVNKLGFAKAFTMNDNEGKPWIEYLKVSDNQFLELFYTKGSAQENQSYAHLCLQVDDIQEISHRMKAKGVHLDVEIQQGKDTNFQCWVKDPDGNRIEFMMYSETAKQLQV